jgi:rhodanese-related sulfurtransferase
MTNQNRTSWLPGAATVLAILSCYGTMALVGLLSLLGLALHIDDGIWAAAISVFSVVAVVAIAASVRRHGSIWPTGMAIVGLALILWSLHGTYLFVVEAMGFALVIAAAFWDRRIGGKPTMDTVSWIDPAELRGHLKGPTMPAIIDVRGPDEFSGPLGHIATARNLPVAQLAERLREIESLKREPVILVCRTDKRSAAASAVLRSAGFKDVLVLRGGMEQWNRESR